MIKPLPGYVLIEPLEADEKTASGLVIPDSAKDKPVRGKVLAVGDALNFQDVYPPDVVTNIPHKVGKVPVKEGQTAIYRKWAGQDVTDGDKELKLVAFGDLLGVVE